MATYQPHLDAAAQHLEAMLNLAKRLNDAEFVEAADSLLVAFRDYAAECQRLIDAANAPQIDDAPSFSPSLVHPDDPCQSRGYVL